jgi:glycosyltransferase involved in cell wall biosynthesis
LTETKNDIELSIVMPCLNEAETVGECVRNAKEFLEHNNINGEIIVADNGSTDGSEEIATEEGARVVNVPDKGYGSALRGGIEAAEGHFVILADTDGSHDIKGLMPFVEKLRQGYDMVVGNRFKGDIQPGAMSFLNKYIGNPILSGIGKIFYRSKVSDFHCGLRGFKKEIYPRLGIRTTGMEFASEMIVKASLFGVNITEVPTNVMPAGRTRPPHLRRFSDGWRHLRFLLLYSPRWLFLYPGFVMILMGIGIGLWLLPGSKLSLDIHTMLYASAALIIGVQSLAFAVLSKVFAMDEKLLPQHPRLNKMLKFMTLERGLIIGALLGLLGIIGSLYAVFLLETGEFRGLGITHTMRIVILSVTFLLLGSQIIFTSFFYSILRLKLK